MKYAMIGLHIGDTDRVRAVRCEVYDEIDFRYKLKNFYPRRTLVLPLILGGNISLLGETFLSTEYSKDKGSRFYRSAEEYRAENLECSSFFVISSNNFWYFSRRNPRSWKEVK